MFNRIREDVANILARDPAARTSWEVLTCYAGFHAITIHRLAHCCWILGFKWLGRFLSHFARIFTGIEIHPGATIGRRVFIDHGFGVVIGETAIVGDDCTIYQGVTLGGTTLSKGTKRHPTLERGVIVGAGAQILGGFSVGEFAKIGSNAVVVKPVPAGATAVGNPAHVVQKDTSKGDEAANAKLFSAYGLTPGGDDPLSKALHSMINHASAQDQRIASILATLKSAGIVCQCPDEAESFDSEKLNQMVD